MDLRGKVTSWGQRPVAYVRAEWNRMAPRERRLVAILVGAVGAFAMLVASLLMMQSLREIAESNDAAREALSAIAKNREEYLEAKERMVAQEMRIGTEPPQLLGDLESAAREVGFQLAETTEVPPQPAGKRYLEHGMRVKIRQVDLKSLTNFLSRVETGRRMIVVTRLQIRRRFTSDQETKMDVELTAIAWERLKQEQKVRPKAKGRAS